MLGFARAIAPNTKQSQLARVFVGGHLRIIKRIHSLIAKCKVHICDTGTEVSRIYGSLDCIVPELVCLGICNGGGVWNLAGSHE